MAQMLNPNSVKSPGEPQSLVPAPPESSALRVSVCKSSECVGVGRSAGESSKNEVSRLSAASTQLDSSLCSVYRPCLPVHVTPLSLFFTLCLSLSRGGGGRKDPRSLWPTCTWTTAATPDCSTLMENLPKVKEDFFFTTYYFSPNQFLLL